jgi:hypothetical protein
VKRSPELAPLSREHQAALAIALAHRPGVDAARRAGALLAAHVRFEERVVFAHLEAALPPAELAAIGRRLGGATVP